MKLSFRKLAIFIGVFWVVCVCSETSRADSSNVSAQQIRSSIDKSRKYLLSEQLTDGSWEADPRMYNGGSPSHSWGGYTSLATYALLVSGSKAQDPPIQKALEFLEKADITGIYGLGLRVQVWRVMFQLTGSSKFKTLAGKDITSLLTGLNASGPYAGMWGYNGNATRIDHSVSQYGVLGLSTAEQMGGTVPARAWTLIDRTWRSHQFPGGGWSYASSPLMPDSNFSGRGGITMSMTAAGVATLLSTREWTIWQRTLKRSTICTRFTTSNASPRSTDTNISAIPIGLRMFPPRSLPTKKPTACQTGD
jgi:hypothetical protein